MKWIILVSAVFGLCYGDGPVFSGYAPSGWTPDGASFKLPTEYGAPVEEEQPHASEVEITQENIQFAGMLGETTTAAVPSNTYLPPPTDNAATTTELPEEQPEEQPDFISVQGLPKTQGAQYRVRADFRLPQQQQQFRQQPQQFQQQQQFRQQPQQQFRGNLRQAPQQSQFRGNLRQAPPPPQQQQQGIDQRTNGFAEFVPQNQAAPANNQFAPNGRLQAPRQRQQQNFNFRSQQQFGRLELTPPATSYGVPVTQYGPPPQERVNDATTTITPNEETTESGEDETPESPQEVATDDYDESSEGGPVVAISNASDNASRGQYYILAPDNTLQKVVFMTSQTEEDRRMNGFSAQLKYSPVAPIRDPIYAYNQQGQLVRIYRKK